MLTEPFLAKKASPKKHEKEQTFKEWLGGWERHIKGERKKPNLQELIDILALPNMGDEGRKEKLIAIKAWQIEFEKELLQMKAFPESWYKSHTIDIMKMFDLHSHLGIKPSELIQFIIKEILGPEAKPQ